MYFLDAFLYPFKSKGAFGKVLIGLLANIIPILGSIFILGYCVRVVRNAGENNPDLPEWNDWGSDFGRGILLVVTYIFYGIIGGVPAILLSAIGLGGTILSIVGVVWGILVGFVAYTAVAEYAHTGNFSAVFNVVGLINKTLSGPGIIGMLMFLINVILFGIIAGIAIGLGMVLLVIPGLLIASAVTYGTHVLIARWGQACGIGNPLSA
jgi:hypothetical protein